MVTATERMEQRIADGLKRRDERKHVENGGGGGDNGDMDARLTTVEADVKDIKKDLVDLKVSLASISGKMDIIVSKMPSWWQAPVGAGGLIALMAALVGLAKALKWI